MQHTYYVVSESSELQHHGIKGMHWGVRRFQNKDGTYTDFQKRRLERYKEKEHKRTNKKYDTPISELKLLEKTNKERYKETKNKIYKDTASSYRTRARVLEGYKYANNKYISNMTYQQMKQEKRYNAGRRALEIGGPLAVLVLTPIPLAPLYVSSTQGNREKVRRKNTNLDKTARQYASSHK